eukprot:SAG11_NODE_56_length_19295_cov_20.219675_12_plen_130_part_00
MAVIGEQTGCAPQTGISYRYVCTPAGMPRSVCRLRLSSSAAKISLSSAVGPLIPANSSLNLKNSPRLGAPGCPPMLKAVSSRLVVKRSEASSGDGCRHGQMSSGLATHVIPRMCVVPSCEACKHAHPAA